MHDVHKYCHLILAIFYTDNRTEIEFYGEHFEWAMNAGPDPLERRSEVQFYDVYDLVGYGNESNENSKGKTICFL